MCSLLCIKRNLVNQSTVSIAGLAAPPLSTSKPLAGSVPTTQTTMAAAGGSTDPAATFTTTYAGTSSPKAGPSEPRETAAAAAVDTAASSSSAAHTATDTENSSPRSDSSKPLEAGDTPAASSSSATASPEIKDTKKRSRSSTLCSRKKKKAKDTSTDRISASSKTPAAGFSQKKQISSATAVVKIASGARDNGEMCPHLSDSDSSLTTLGRTPTPPSAIRKLLHRQALKACRCLGWCTCPKHSTLPPHPLPPPALGICTRRKAAHHTGVTAEPIPLALPRPSPAHLTEWGLTADAAARPVSGLRSTLRNDYREEEAGVWSPYVPHWERQVRPAAMLAGWLYD